MYMEVSEMDERIVKLLSEMDPYMPSGTMIGFLRHHNKRITFNVNFSKDEKAEDISALDISVRANHCLRRAGYHTIGELVNGITAKPDEEGSKTKLLKLRNLGSKTAEEILLMIMCYQFKILPEKERRAFVGEIVSLNS